MLASWRGLACMVLIVGCTSLTEDSTTVSPTTTTAAPLGTVSCEPSPRFRLGGIEYEVRTFDDVVDDDQVGDVVGEPLTLPAAVRNCEPFVVLKDGEGSLATGTRVYQIVGVDVSEALTASLGGDFYLRFVAKN